MIRRPPRSTRPYTLLPDTTLCRSDGNFSFDGRLSRISSDGYVDRGASNLQSFFVSGAWHGRHSLLRANVFGGKEKTYQRSEEHTSELQSLMRISYAVFCLKNKNQTARYHQTSSDQI